MRQTVSCDVTSGDAHPAAEPLLIGFTAPYCDQRALEASFGELPQELRHQVWMDVMFECGSKPRNSSPETLASIEAILADH